jgi:hypothetical protein
MYEFHNPMGVTLTCGACGHPTLVSTAVPVRVGTAPTWMRVETGRWNWDLGCAETRTLKLPNTETVEGCPACADRLARQKRAGGDTYLLRATSPASRTHATMAMPRLVKHRKAATP